MLRDFELRLRDLQLRDLKLRAERLLKLRDFKDRLRDCKFRAESLETEERLLILARWRQPLSTKLRAFQMQTHFPVPCLCPVLLLVVFHAVTLLGRFRQCARLPLGLFHDRTPVSWASACFVSCGHTPVSSALLVRHPQCRVVRL